MASYIEKVREALHAGNAEVDAGMRKISRIALDDTLQHAITYGDPL